MTDIIVDRLGPVVRLTLNRPSVLNCLSLGLARNLACCIREVSRAGNARCVVLTGAGRAFCSGFDLRELSGSELGRYDLGVLLRTVYNPVITALTDLQVPTVAAVNGLASGAGVSLALACDVVIASTEATFTQSFIEVGLLPDCAATYWLPRVVGWRRAAALMMSGDTLSARDAELLGLSYRTVDAGEFEATAIALATRLAARSATAISLIRRALRASAENGLGAQLELEAQFQTQAGHSPEHIEAVAAFRRRCLERHARL